MKNITHAILLCICVVCGACNRTDVKEPSHHDATNWHLTADVELIYDGDSSNPVESQINRVMVSLSGPADSWSKAGENVSKSDFEGVYTHYEGFATATTVTLVMRSGENREILNSDVETSVSLLVSNGRVEAERKPMDMIVIRTAGVVPSSRGMLPIEFVFGDYEAAMVEDEEIPSVFSSHGADLKDFSIGRGAGKWLFGNAVSAKWKLRGEQDAP